MIIPIPMKKLIFPLNFLLFTTGFNLDIILAQQEFTITEAEYLTSPDADVFVFGDTYFEEGE